ncbi:MAG: peptidylprolyl isomerase [Chloroflexota bacterium]
MSKREQTTGLPKEGETKPTEEASSTPVVPKPRPSKRQEYRSRAEREAEIQRYVILGTGIAVAVIVIILAAAIIVDQVITPNQAVASVNGQNITVTQFEKRVRLERVLRIQRITSFVNFYRQFGYPDDQIGQQLQQQEPFNTYYNELQIPDKMGLTVVNDMIEDELIRQAAAEKGITATQDQIQEQINQFFGYDPAAIAAAEATPESTAETTATVEPSPTPTPFVSPTPSPTPTITPTPELTATATLTPQATIPPAATLNSTEQADQFTKNKADFYTQLRSETGMSDGEINTYFESLALRKALRDSIATDVTTTGTFVDARHILVATEDEAKDIVDALNGGESFADLAKAVSTDTGSGAKGGELGWTPVSQFVKPFADAASTAEIGAVVGPVKSEFGYHVIQVRAREDRDLSKDQIETAKENEFKSWLDDLKTSKADQTKTFDIWVNYVPTDPASPFGQATS